MSKRQMLGKMWCLASCGQFVHLYHLFCMKDNAIFHFYCSLYLLIHHVVLLSGLPVSQQFGYHCHPQVNFETAVYDISNWAKLWYRTIWNKIDTGIFPIPVYCASLQHSSGNTYSSYVLIMSVSLIFLIYRWNLSAARARIVLSVFE